MAINFAAASTAGLNNPGTEIITLVKDGSGNFINPPSYDKMRAYLSSGEVPMLFVTDEGGETGSLYQLAEYSETENKIRFGNDVNAIEFSAGAAAPVVSDVVPKPLTYDYMPEGYPKKAIQTVTLMEGAAVELTVDNNFGIGMVNNIFDVNFVVGNQYVINLDGAEYNVTAKNLENRTYLGNLILMYMTQLVCSYDTAKTYLDEHGISYTEEPFFILYAPNSPSANKNQLIVRSTSASHIIGVSEASEVITPMTEEFMPVLTAPNGTKYKITVDDSGTISATEVT